jgi:hypothetical protein
MTVDRVARCFPFCQQSIKDRIWRDKITDLNVRRVFLRYSQGNHDSAEALARRPQADARFSFWFSPCHNVPGVPVQEQTKEALWEAWARAVFSGYGPIEGW